MRKVQTWTWALAASALIAGCGGEGGGCLAPTDFPVDQRISNAVQVRLAQPAFNRIGTNVKELVTAAFGSTRLGFEPLCEGDVQVCCGLPADTCGITLDLEERPGEPPRLSFTELSDGRQGLNVTFKTRVLTERTLDLMIIGPLGGQNNCTVDINTNMGATPDITIGAALTLEEDPMTGQTRVGLTDLVLSGIEAADIDNGGGGIVCGGIDNSLDDIEAGLTEALKEQAPKLLEVPLCKSCMTDADCGAGTCNEELVCEAPSQGEEAPRCLQQLGTVGRFPAGELFGALAGDAALDLYLVSNAASAPSGGLSFSGNSGIYLPTIEGVAPASPSCAPSVPAPEAPDGGIEFSEMMGANALDDLGSFDFGIALHKSFLDRAGWAFHQAGLFCTTIDATSNEKLNADSFAIMFPSLADLVDGANTPISVRLRPQKPPTFRMDDPAGAVVVEFVDFDVDFFMSFRERNVRLFTARSDVSIPLDLGSDDKGAVVPVIGDMSEAFRNIRVTNPGLLAEPNDEVAAKFEAIGGLSVSMLIGSIGTFELPSLPFLAPEVLEKGLRGLDNGQFLGLMGNLRVGAPQGMPFAADSDKVQTRGELARVEMPEAAAYSAPTLDRAKQPTIELSLGADGPLSDGFEWQYRIDGGAWSPQHRDPNLRISRIELWVPTVHKIEVRARHQDRPKSTDPTPTTFMVDLRPRPEALAGALERDADQPFADDTSENGCASSSSGKGALWLVLAMLCSLLLLRRRPSALLGLLLLSSTQTACLIGGDNTREKGPAYGRWSDVASDGIRAVASSYEARKGDLVLGTVVASGVRAFQVVDEDGDVGAWSSVVLAGGYARIAYQDRTSGRLKFATEKPNGEFDLHVLDESDGVTIGRYATLANRPGGGLGLVYLAEAPQEDGGMITQLRYAETALDTPSSQSDWTREPLQFARTQTTETAPVDSVPLGTGLYSKLAYTSKGEPIIAYCDTTAPALVVARREGGEWSTSVLDDNVETGPCAFASLAVGADDSVHVAYQTTIAGDLRYVGLGPSDRVGDVTIVDNGARASEQRPVGGSASIILDDRGSPIIVYQDGYTLELRIARQSGGTFSHDVAATGPLALGFSVGLAWFKNQLIISSGAVNRDELQAHQITSTVLKKP